MTGQWVACVVGLTAGALVGVVGVLLGVLTSGAVLALALVAAANFGLGGWTWGATLLVGALSSILWAGYRARRTGRSRMGQRTGWLPVMARLGWPTLLVGLGKLTESHDALFPAYVGALAVGAADAWATEVGMLSPQRPRLIISGQRMPAGTPGAVSMLGSVAGLGGAWLVGLAAMLLTVLRAVIVEGGMWNRALLWLPLRAALGGVIGCALDSFLGATAQAHYYCDHCDAYGDTPVHSCGRVAVHVKGWSWLTSEGVDLVSAMLGAAVAAALLR